MKAKEYAEQYKNEGETNEALGKVFFGMLGEVKTLVELRKAETDLALISILNEMDEKWRAFARQVNGVNKDGFATLHRNRFPEIHSEWMKHRQHRGLSVIG